jgi:hypothetical protein
MRVILGDGRTSISVVDGISILGWVLADVESTSVEDTFYRHSEPASGVTEATLAPFNPLLTVRAQSVT